MGGEAEGGAGSGAQGTGCHEGGVHCCAAARAQTAVPGRPAPGPHLALARMLSAACSTGTLRTASSAGEYPGHATREL